jgi:uncharacterized membrane protein SpoIIM required for sporulation
MDPQQFISTREPGWHQLEDLLSRARRDPAGLSEQELVELGRLYRLATADLALAQRDYPSHPVNRYLNSLVARAHVQIYRSEPLSWRQLGYFFRHGFPALYRAFLPYTIVAFLLFAVPAVAAFLAVAADADRIFAFLGPSAAELVRTVERGRTWTDIGPSIRSAAAAGIMTNNIQVMFLTFAGGITAGLLTAWVLVQNGIVIGAVFGLLQAHDMAPLLANFVAAHGFIELSVIFLAGGCGLAMGDSLLRPGLQSRREALVGRAQDSVLLILGCIPLLVLAGLIEGFVSPSRLLAPLKLVIGLGTGVALYTYWLQPGPRDRR